nr:hypothetical protein [Ectobacillus panaciterrae]
MRYADVFRSYVDSIFHATTLDRNQIIRGALFVAAQSKEFQELLEPYKKKDVSLPSSLWGREQHVLWLEQCPEREGGDKDVNANDKRTSEVNRNSETHKRYEANSQKEQSQDTQYIYNKSIEERKKQIPPQPRPKPKVINQGGITIKIG